MKDLPQIDYVWIDTDAELERLVESWLSCAYLIIDTEFERTNTYFAKPGLIQIADADGIYLIDPLALKSLKPLGRVLADPSIEIVMHSMSEDVDLLSYVCDCSISSLFDTQVAAAFLGYGLSLGYQGLVEKILGVELDKSETRSNWLRRPLTQEQVTYAAADVFYLADIYPKLLEGCVQSGWLDAVREECAAQVDSILSPRLYPEAAYLKLRGGWDLSIADQFILKQLVIWRDALAVKEDVPKSWVFSDAQLIEVVRSKPTDVNYMRSIDKVKPKSLRLYGQTLVDLLGSLENGTPPASFQEIDRPVKGKELEFYRAIKKELSSAAAEAGIDPQLIAARKQMEAWVIHLFREKNDTLPVETVGWRKQLIADRIERLAR
jgi:ribonuclease D